MNERRNYGGDSEALSGRLEDRLIGTKCGRHTRYCDVDVAASMMTVRVLVARGDRNEVRPVARENISRWNMIIGGLRAKTVCAELSVRLDFIHAQSLFVFELLVILVRMKFEGCVAHGSGHILPNSDILSSNLKHLLFIT